MKKFLLFFASRQFLASVALIVVALVIWFVGPFVTFGGLKPLAWVGIRVLLIALLLIGVLLWLSGRSTSAVLVALLCLLIWYASPLLSFGRTAPFEPVSVRLTAIGLVLAVFLTYWLFRLYQRMRDDEQFLKTVLHFGSKKNKSPVAPRLKTVEASMTSALARLKAMRTGAHGPARIFQGKRYLYELPWFITLGSKDSGKTTALLNAGLSFPVAEQMQCAAGVLKEGVAAVEWWLTNDAVLIDTAGYYTRHGSSPVGDARTPARKSDQPTATKTPDEVTAGSQTKGEGPGSDAKADSPESKPAATESSPIAAAPSIRADTDVKQQDVDRAEWLGFLGVLRRNRPRAPINGALLAVDLATLASADEQTRIAEAAALRARLAELRQELGIRFPIYLVVTKMDRLTGFTEYFGALSPEGRAQAWGFALPYGKETVAKEGLRARCHDELMQLAGRLADTVDSRLRDEYDARKRTQLAALHREFSALIGPLVDLIDRVFLSSRYDDTQLHSTLRGVYFTSALQRDNAIVVDRCSVAQRLASTKEQVSTACEHPEGNQSFFLHGLLTRVVFPEAHLVTPNLRWEFRYRLLRVIGHALALLLFSWLAIGLRLSFGHNSGYLDAIGRKAQALAGRVTQFNKEPKAVPDMLTEARNLPSFPGLNLSDPDSTWRYGLYSPPEVVKESHHTYDALEDSLLLPQVVNRMAGVISQAIAKKDSKSAYDALRVYLMLHDKAKFNADDVKAWVLDDWATNDSAAAFGGRASMIDHVQQLFSGERVVQSPLVRNDALVKQARAFLDGSNATDRLYQRAKAAMQKEAPDEFTLLRAVGPQAGTVFTRESGAPLSRGVPGLFTFDGYRNLFDKRLTEFVKVAREDDAWVMGRSYLGEAQKKTAEIVSTAGGADDALTDAVRREYLMEYVQQWNAFLSDIHTLSGTSLAFNLHLLRSFAAPDSPLARLARAAVQETTLTQIIAGQDSSLLRKAAEQLSQKADKALGIRASERVERELVDNQFAALREVVSGNADVQAGAQPGAARAVKTGLDSVTSLLNDYYTALTVADNALSNNSMPPASDTAAKLKMTADTMPAPFRAVLAQLAAHGSHEVNQGIGQLLSRQMQAVVGDACRLTIEGNFPFVPQSTREVSIDDFTRVFAQGGVIDDFFTKTLAPFVDTATKPWRYRTLPGATEPVQGPDLEPFEHAKAIRDMFFNDPGHKQLNWKADIRIPELDPTITSLSLDIDGQATLYKHGPVAPFTVMWPGPRGGVHTEITASPRIRPDTSTITTDGPWALFRLLQKGHLAETATPGRTRVAFDLDGRKAVLDIASAGSVANPLASDVFKTFQCPTSMPMFNLPNDGPPLGLPRGLPAMNAADASA